MISVVDAAPSTGAHTLTFTHHFDHFAQTLSSLKLTVDPLEVFRTQEMMEKALFSTSQSRRAPTGQEFLQLSASLTASAAIKDHVELKAVPQKEKPSGHSCL